jgi:antitoxin MazE
MKTQISRWGNSLAMRIPAAYVRELELEDGAEVELARVNGGMLVRATPRGYLLRDLLDEVRPENIHGQTEWGSPVGGETW